MDFSTALANPELAVSLLVGFVLPAIVAFVTKKVASRPLKSAALLVLSAVSTTLVQLLSTGDISAASFVNGFVATFVAAVSSHYGALKPLGVTGTDGTIQTRFPGGLGKTPTEPDSEEGLPGVVEDEVSDEVVEVDLVEEVDNETTLEDLQDVGGHQPE